MSRPIGNLRELIWQQLPAIDSALAETGALIMDRRWRAARFIIEHCIVSVDGQDKSEYPTSAWFAAVYWPVDEWYARRYGRRLLDVRSSATSRLGLALYRGQLIQIEVPLCLHRSSPVEDCIELLFPLGIEVDEDILAMLNPMPDRRATRSREGRALVAGIADIIVAHRRIWSLVITASNASNGGNDLRKALLEQLDSVATRSLLSAGHSLGLALFDLRMCCEIALKMHLQQTSSDFLRVHDFERLLSSASSEIRCLYQEQLPSAIKEYSSVNAFRYGDVANITTSDFFEVYRQTLRFLEACLRLLSRDIILDGMVCTMRRGSWANIGPKAIRYG